MNISAPSTDFYFVFTCCFSCLILVLSLFPLHNGPWILVRVHSHPERSVGTGKIGAGLGKLHFYLIFGIFWLKSCPRAYTARLFPGAQFKSIISNTIPNHNHPPIPFQDQQFNSHRENESPKDSQPTDRRVPSLTDSLPLPALNLPRIDDNDPQQLPETKVGTGQASFIDSFTAFHRSDLHTALNQSMPINMPLLIHSSLRQT